MNPMGEKQATQYFQSIEEQQKQAQMKKEYQAKLRSNQYEDKNKAVLASFLQIKNK